MIAGHGNPVTVQTAGVFQRPLRACCMRWRVSAPCTDRSSFEHWLERSSHPDLGPGSIGHVVQRLHALNNIQGPP